MRLLTAYNDPNGNIRFGEEEVELRAGIYDQVSGTSRMSSGELQAVLSD